MKVLHEHIQDNQHTTTYTRNSPCFFVQEITLVYGSAGHLPFSYCQAKKTCSLKQKEYHSRLSSLLVVHRRILVLEHRRGRLLGGNGGSGKRPAGVELVEVALRRASGSTVSMPRTNAQRPSGRWNRFPPPWSANKVVSI